MSNRIKMLIVGGCFPVQDNISPDKLYHQILRKQLLESNDINLEIRIIRYENIKKCFNKISEAVVIDKPDLILFHLRTEPILLPAKLFCKYHNREGNLIRRINLSAFNLSYTVKDKQKQVTISENKPAEKSVFQIKIRSVLREFNYFGGYLIGNWPYILKGYLDLVNEIIQLIKNKDLTLIITGPVSRPFSYFENRLSERLHQYMNRYLDQYHQIYLNLLGLNDEQGNFLFCNDLKRVNETGHKRIFKIIYSVFTKNIKSEKILCKESLPLQRTKGAY